MTLLPSQEEKGGKKAPKADGKKGKPQPVREELVEETSKEGVEEAPKVEVPDWDLSITSLLQVGGATSLFGSTGT